jgi:uncharacterized protein (DUF488 family)
MVEPKSDILYTIGHSNHKIGDFISLLKQHGITCVADVRSAPYSRHCPQFNRERLATALEATGITYMFLGAELGGRPRGGSYCEEGRVSFRRIVGSEKFKQGIEWILANISKYRIAIMCAERDPIRCHRTILVSRYLKKHNIHIQHILANGDIEEAAAAERRLAEKAEAGPMLFDL